MLAKTLPIDVATKRPPQNATIPYNPNTMKFFEKLFGRVENTPQSPELTAFAQHLVDNPEVKDKVLDHAQFLKDRAENYGESVYEDRRLMGEGNSLVQPLLMQAGVSLPPDVSMTSFLVELHNRVEEGKDYVPVWLRSEENEPSEPTESMNITTSEEFTTLVEDNVTVASLLEKGFDASSILEKLTGAGYTFGPDAQEIIQNHIAELQSVSTDESEEQAA
ncbi:MAG: hypothetical protein ACI9H6_000860 [Patiriisocius sp.]|jgi:hypothetical protein